MNPRTKPRFSEAPEPAVTIEADSTGPAPADEETLIPVEQPVIEETVKEPEPEAAYWFFKSRPPVRRNSGPVAETSRPSGGFRLSAETGLGNVKPSPAFVLPKYSSQARLDKPLLADTYADPAVIVVEETPTETASTGTEPVSSSIPTVGQTTIYSGTDPETIREAETEAYGPEYPLADEPVPAVSTVDQAASDFQTLENDIAAYRKVTEINPLNDRAWDALGNMYEATGLHSEAIAAFEKAISLASQREVYHYHLGLAHAAQKHYEKAIQSLQKVVALNPDYMLAHCALAGYYRRTGKEAEAREHIVIARPYMESENDYNQACFESICGNTDRAFAFLRNALDKKQIQVELVRSDPDLDFIRSDPRFEELINRKDAGYQPVP